MTEEDIELLVNYLEGHVKDKTYVELSWTEAEYILNLISKEKRK